MVTTMKKMMLGTALVAGLFATGAAANAQSRGFEGRGNDHPGYVHSGVREGYVGRDYAGRERGYPGPEFGRPRFGVGVAVGGAYDGYGDAYIPPCPGDGYVWTAGYYNAGIWVPGAWGFRGGFRDRAGIGFDRGYGERGNGFRGGFHEGFRNDRGAAGHDFRGRR